MGYILETSRLLIRTNPQSAKCDKNCASSLVTVELNSPSGLSHKLLANFREPHRSPYSIGWTMGL